MTPMVAAQPAYWRPRNWLGRRRAGGSAAHVAASTAPISAASSRRRTSAPLPLLAIDLRLSGQTGAGFDLRLVRRRVLGEQTKARRDGGKRGRETDQHHYRFHREPPSRSFSDQS